MPKVMLRPPFVVGPATSWLEEEAGPNQLSDKSQKAGSGHPSRGLAFSCSVWGGEVEVQIPSCLRGRSGFHPEILFPGEFLQVGGPT